MNVNGSILVLGCLLATGMFTLLGCSQPIGVPSGPTGVFTPTSTVSPVLTSTVNPAFPCNLVKGESVSSLTSEQSITYTLSVDQTFTNSVSNIVICDTLPTGVVVGAAWGSGPCAGIITQIGNLLIWSYAGPTTHLQATVNLQCGIHCTGSGSITNVACVTATGFNPSLSNAVVAYVQCSTVTQTPTSTVTNTPTVTPTATATGTLATATFTFTPTKTATITATPTPLTCSQTAAWGDSVIQTGAPISIYADNTYCQQYPLSQTSVVNSISFPIAFAPGGFSGLTAAVGIYTDAHSEPGQLVWNSAFQPIVTGWNVVTVPQVQLTPGNYWLAVSSNAFELLSSPNNSSSTGTWVNGTFPNPFIGPASTPEPVNNSNLFAIYAETCY
jgi:hypothetical protein